MAQMASDRDLLFGILAPQMDFISRDALIAASGPGSRCCTGWRATAPPRRWRRSRGRGGPGGAGPGRLPARTHPGAELAEVYGAPALAREGVGRNAEALMPYRRACELGEAPSRANPEDPRSGHELARSLVDRGIAGPRPADRPKRRWLTTGRRSCSRRSGTPTRRSS
jgi:hypothetical protein